MKTIYRGAGLAWSASQTLCVSLWLASAGLTPAQTSAPVAPPYVPLAPDQMDTIVGPVALYPDPLLAEIFAAATQPTEIVLADRYLSSGGDAGQAGQMGWDASVVALTHYPTVLQWLDQNLSWTTELGQAFLNQQPDLMAAVQRMRRKAEVLGNLPSTAQATVQDDGVAIEIVPVNPTVIYLPVYVTAQVYFEPAPTVPLITFGPPCGLGDWVECDIDWHRHRVLAWDEDHPRPAGWWHESAQQRESVVTVTWHPAPYHGHDYDGWSHGGAGQHGDAGQHVNGGNGGNRGVAEGGGAHPGTTGIGNQGNNPGRRDYSQVVAHPPIQAPTAASSKPDSGHSRSAPSTGAVRAPQWPSAPAPVAAPSTWPSQRQEVPTRPSPAEGWRPNPGTYVPASPGAVPHPVPPPVRENNASPTYRYEAPESGNHPYSAPTHNEPAHETSPSHSSSGSGGGSSGGSVNRQHDATNNGNHP